MKNKLFAFTAFVIALTSCDTLNKINDAAKVLNAVPTNEEVVRGLKDALKLGIGSGTDMLSKAGSFFNDNALKILLPPDVAKMEARLRDIGLGADVDRAIKSLNDGAEKAVGLAKPIFTDAITNMSFSDAMSILKGGKSSATNYLKQTTTTALLSAFKPVIQNALDQVGATKYWTDLVTIYNKIPFVEKINSDLNGYVTEKATTALFNVVEKEENAIRDNPAKRTTEILRKVFSYADSQK